MEISIDESVRLAPHQPIYPDSCNVLISRGDSGIATFGLPMQSHDINIQCAIRSPMIDSSSQTDYTVNQNVIHSESPYASISSSQSCGTPLPGVSPVTENFQSLVPGYVWDYLLGDDGGSFQTSTWENMD